MLLVPGKLAPPGPHEQGCRQRRQACTITRLPECRAKLRHDQRAASGHAPPHRKLPVARQFAVSRHPGLIKREKRYHGAVRIPFVPHTAVAKIMTGETIISTLPRTLCGLGLRARYRLSSPLGSPFSGTARDETECRGAGGSWCVTGAMSSDHRRVGTSTLPGLSSARRPRH